MYWRIIEKHPELIFKYKSDEEILCDSDPLFKDESDIQLLKFGKKKFQFNNGYNKVHFTHYTASIKDVYLDPIYFIIIKRPITLIKESIIFDWYRISFKKYVLIFLLRHFKKINEVVIFDAKIGLNVFHFYNDILPKLFIAKARLPNIPLLISEELYVSKLFQYYLQFDFVKNNTWQIVRKNEYLYVKKIHLIKTPEYNIKNLKIIADKALFMTPITSSNKLKLFINRKESSGRTIANFKDLEPILQKLKFTILYLEDLTVAEQIESFSKAKIIIGIHGAGLTNLIFSYKNNPKILEITASDFMPTHYYWLANSFAFSYNLFLGGETRLSLGQIQFDVDIMRLENILSNL
jgi:hypothetical protein